MLAFHNWMLASVLFQRKIFVYVPAAYKNGTKAPVLVIHDGPGQLAPVRNALDHHSALQHARAVSSAGASLHETPSLAKVRALSTAQPRPHQSQLRPQAHLQQFALRVVVSQALENRLGPNVQEAESRNGAGLGSCICVRSG
jgi:hypothetical protein